MSPSLFKRRQRIVSVTIESDAIRYAELRSANPLVLERVGEVLLPSGSVDGGQVADPAALAAAVEGAVGQWGIGRRRVRFLAPDNYVMIRKVQTPADVPEDELKGYFFIEIGSSLYLPFDDPLFDVVPYTGEGEERESLIIATKESVIRQYERALDGAKLKPVECDIAPLALYRLAYLQHGLEEKRNVLVADFHDGNLTVSIFHNHQPLFMRPIDFGEDEDRSPDAAYREISKIINFYTFNMMDGNETIDCLFIAGEYEGAEELNRLFREQMGQETGHVLKEPAVDAAGWEWPARFDRVIGLALKEV
ncbi:MULTISPECIES: type IV pilus biogenesis protein PilM [Bhargavaea]|uniref:Type IV pilus biogenesis protein PilM n=1 Tax=Bhargavaea changchunensis TaxID=2134037 RepID=A0ABW2NC91_9BACL|nr:pilus assembly protein PilM [Bhargavaea sp. CC-171006]